MKKIDQRGAIGPIELVLIIAILAIIGFVGYRIYQTNGSEEVKNNTAQNTETVDTTKETDDANTEDQENTEDATQTQFTAEVGKFTLSLPSDYAVIKSVDGSFAARNSTQIEIVTATTDEENVFYSTPSESDQNRLTALEKNDVESSLDEYIASVSRSAGNHLAESDSTTTVDGETAQVRYFGGYGKYVAIFWEKDNILYSLQGSAGSEVADYGETNSTIEAIIDGFSFN